MRVIVFASLILSGITVNRQAVKKEKIRVYNTFFLCVNRPREWVVLAHYCHFRGYIIYLQVYANQKLGEGQTNFTTIGT